MNIFIGHALAGGGGGGFNDYFVKVVNGAIGIAGLFSVLIVIYAGFVYAKSQGDAAKISSAKELISGVIIGLVMLIFIKILQMMLLG